MGKRPNPTDSKSVAEQPAIACSNRAAPDQIYGGRSSEAERRSVEANVEISKFSGYPDLRSNYSI